MRLMLQEDVDMIRSLQSHQCESLTLPAISGISCTPFSHGKNLPIDSHGGSATSPIESLRTYVRPDLISLHLVQGLVRVKWVVRPSARAQIGMIEHAHTWRGKQGARVKCIAWWENVELYTL